MRILVTGSEGYLGRVLTSFLWQAGHSLDMVDLGVFDPHGDRKWGEHYAPGDIRNADPDWFRWKYLPVQYDAVVNLAAISNDPAGELDPSLTWGINCEAAGHLARLAKEAGTRRFVFASSASVYGKLDRPAREDDPKDPQTAYARSKLKAESEILNLASPDFQPIVLRFGTLFGPSPRMRFDLAVNLMAKTALCEGKIVVNGGKQWRPFLHVADAARAILHALDVPDSPEIVNVAWTNIQVDELATMIHAQLSPVKRCKVETLPGASDSRDYRLDTSRMCHEFGFSPIHSLPEGIAQVAGWILAMGVMNIDLDADDYYTLRMWKKWLRKQGVAA